MSTTPKRYRYLSDEFNGTHSKYFDPLDITDVVELHALADLDFTDALLVASVGTLDALTDVYGDQGWRVG